MSLSNSRYNTYQESLKSLNIELSTAEIHGVICGYLCTARAINRDAMLQNILSRTEAGDVVKEAVLKDIAELFNASHQALSCEDLTFSLILPDDDAEIEYRVDAFGDWCYGFLSAFGNDEEHQVYSPEIQEILRDIADFSKIDYDTVDIYDSDEKDLFELTDYVRLAVHMIYHSKKPQDLTPSN